jgi:hypothetical protein
MAIAIVLSTSSAGEKAERMDSAWTLASRLAALIASNSSTFSSSRAKAWTSRTAAMFSCSSALTSPIVWRVRRNATRARRAKTVVVRTITGRTAKLASASRRLRLSIETTMPTSDRLILASRTTPPLKIWLMTWVSLTRRDIRSPASCWSKNASESAWMRWKICVRMWSNTRCPARVIR